LPSFCFGLHEAEMTDIVFALATLVFFFLSALYVQACDRLR